MKHNLILSALLTITVAVAAQEPNVLFIGNSYTEVNNLPQMVYNVAQSMGESITYASNTPGGCTFQQHCTNRSMDLIRQGGWDIVVLQEQSQYPSFPQSQVEAEVFPYAERLIDSVYAHNPCAEPMFYMTWGRKNGDQLNAQYFPILGTYEGMDSMLCERYTYMAETYDASLCPVGRVWRYIRTYYPDIELYQSDDSHPSLAGTYAAACAFYTMIFHNDPNNISYAPDINAETARAIRLAAHTVVYEQLTQWTRPMPAVSIDTLRTENNTVWFSYECLNADSLTWHFGDGTDTIMSSGENHTIQHTYADSGQYTVTVVASRHCLADTSIMQIHTFSDSNHIGTSELPIFGGEIRIYPNPTSCNASITTPTPAQATLTSLDGRTIWHSKTTPGETVIPLQQLPAGTYLLTIVTQNTTTTHKVIKK